MLITHTLLVAAFTHLLDKVCLILVRATNSALEQ